MGADIIKEDDSFCLDREIKEMKLKKDLQFLKERFFKSDAALGRMLGVTGKVMGDWLKRNHKKHDRTYNHVLVRVNLIKRAIKEVDNYDPEEFFIEND